MMEGRLKGRYRYGCKIQGSGYICGFLTDDGELETLACSFWHGRSGKKEKKQTHALLDKDYLLMKREARQAGLSAELSRFRREILHKTKKADERRRKRKEVAGQLRFVEEKAS